jgi:hypothetical protein
MKNLFKVSLLLIVSLCFYFISCDNDNDTNINGFDEYYDQNYRENINGTIEVINSTNHDMLLFPKGVLIKNNIVGGIRAGKTTQINFASESDFLSGGYKIIYAVKQSEFEKEKENSSIDYTGVITYRDGARFRITIQSRFDGNYQFTASNRNPYYSLELRKNSYDGEKIAFLLPGELYHIIRTTSNTPFAVYPVWVAFNSLTKSIMTFSLAGYSQVQIIQPNIASEDYDYVHYYFPTDENVNIDFEIEIPFALVKVTNNTNLSAVLRNGGAQYVSQNNFEYITGAATESYYITSNSTYLNLNLQLIGTLPNIIVPVRFEDAPGELPLLENGWVYTVLLNLRVGGDLLNEDDYSAWLVKVSQINQRDFLSGY